MEKKSAHQIPSGIAPGALVGYINTATFCTTELDAYRFFYGDVMKMQIEGPFNLSHEEKASQRAFWQIPEELDYDLYHIYRASVPSLIHLRIIHLKTATPHIHNSYSSYELGSFSLGFPTSDAKGMDKRMQEFEIRAMAPMQVGDIVRADGSEGQYLETIYQGPDFLHTVGIERLGVPQLAPCDPKDGFGGPGYSALVASDSDAEIAFYTEVLGHATLLDAIWNTAEGSALGIEPGVPFRFTSIYAPGAEQNHVIILEYKNGGAIDTGVPSHLPYQGLGMYTFMTSSIDTVMQRAKAHDAKVLSEIQEVNDNIHGAVKACLLQAPSGFYMEIFEKV